MIKKYPAKLILDNQTIFHGYSLGSQGTTIGELCFNTGMTGYQEILTDPSYCEQIVAMTTPHIGNYGVNSKDVESKQVQVKGFIVKENSPIFSNYRAEDSLANYLKKNNIVAIEGIDTRALTRILRNEGSMNGIISSENISTEKLKQQLKLQPSMDGTDLAKIVTCKKNYGWNQNKNNKYKIAVIDYGIKHNILRLLENENCYIRIFPANVNSDEIISFRPDGIFLSNGPGDPTAVDYGIETVKNLLAHKIPIFGICLGHQILSLALGARTYKLKFGHRGCNHPVKNLDTGIIEITSQNHGFTVDSNKLPKNIEITHLSVNDKTIEGIKSTIYPAFSVQYHPESSPGPHDSRYLFKKFINLITKYKNKHA